MFTYETANVKVKSSKNFLSPKNGQILAVFGVRGSGVRKSFDFYCKRHICTRIHVVCDIPRENWLGRGLQVGWGKNKESNKHRIFHIFTQKPPLLRSSLNLFWGLTSRDIINCAKFHSNPFRGFDFVGGRILAFPIGMRCRR